MFYTAFLLGLLGSFHCVGMCGPIALALPIHTTNNPIHKFVKILLYHLGRILAYATIGFLFGSLGKGLHLSGFQQRLSILIGIILIVSILFPAKSLNKFRTISPLKKLIHSIVFGFGKLLNRKSFYALFFIGFLNGLLPCSMVYVALIGALTLSSAIDGFLYMTLYGMGTIPLITVVLYAKSIFSLQFRNKIQKAIPIFVVLLGLLFVLRGAGFRIPLLSPSNTSLQIKSIGKTCLPNTH